MVGGGELAGPLGAVRDDAWAAGRLAGAGGANETPEAR